VTREELYALHDHWYEGGTLNNDQISAVLVLALDAFPKADRKARSSKARGEEQALALLRELNDALAIPGEFQPRVDAVLDRAEH
jgi:hypothetical protein